MQNPYFYGDRRWIKTQTNKRPHSQNVNIMCNESIIVFIVFVLLIFKDWFVTSSLP